MNKQQPVIAPNVWHQLEVDEIRSKDDDKVMFEQYESAKYLEGWGVLHKVTTIAIYDNPNGTPDLVNSSATTTITDIKGAKLAYKPNGKDISIVSNYLIKE